MPKAFLADLYTCFDVILRIYLYQDYIVVVVIDITVTYKVVLYFRPKLLNCAGTSIKLFLFFCRWWILPHLFLQLGGLLF